MNCLLYVRVSKGRNPKTLTLSTQVKAMERYARRNGWKIVGRFVDRAESGSDRPERKRMMQYCRKSKGIGVVLVYSIDRLTRTLLDHVTIRQTLEKKGIQLVSVSECFDNSPIDYFRQRNIICRHCRLVQRQ